MLQEGIFTIFNEIDEMKSELKAMLKPNGSQQAPARSCYDLFLCNPSFEAGYYWIDPNVGNPSDAVQVYCKRPGCSCLDCEAPTNSHSRQQWRGATDKYFTELGYELHCPIPSDQLSLLRLLSSEANQVFTYYPSSKSELSFVGANGETLKADSEHVTTDKLSSSRTDFTLSGEPDWFPLDDFVAREDDFGFSLGRACFCNTNSLP